MRCCKGSETPSFLMLRARERGSLRPFSPSQKGVSDPFSHCKRASQNPLSETPLTATHDFRGCIFFWYRDVFFVVSRWPKSPFRYRDLFFGIEILHSVVQHLDCLLSGINQCVPFWPSTSCKWRSKKISMPKQDQKISRPKKRHLDTN